MLFRSIRPECFSLRTEKSAVNSVPGTLAESTYLGEIAQYSLKTGQTEPDTLHIAELNPRRVVRDATATFFACCDPEDTVAVPPLTQQG